MKFAERDGVRLGYDERGAGAPPLVFVHGWCCDHSYFAPQFEHFARRHRVMALDQRGFGWSDKPTQEYTIEGFADDLRWLCKERGVDHPVLVGHSLGGAVVLAAAARHPDLPRALVLCDPAIFFSEGADQAQKELLEGLAGEAYREVAADFIGRFLFIDTDDPVRKAEIIAGMIATPRHVMISSFENMRSFDEASAARACRIPVLHIGAENPVADEDRIREHFTEIVVESTPGVGHFHQLEAPERVNSIVARFVTGLDGSGH